MDPSSNIAEPRPSSWTYASLTVLDGDRRIKPAQISPDSLIFDHPPELKSEHIEILLVNGEDEHTYSAKVLPHDRDATWIPIQLIV